MYTLHCPSLGYSRKFLELKKKKIAYLWYINTFNNVVTMNYYKNTKEYKNMNSKLSINSTISLTIFPDKYDQSKQNIEKLERNQ